MPLAYRVKLLALTLTPSTLVHNFRFWFSSNNETLPIPPYWARMLVTVRPTSPPFLILDGAGSIASARRLNGNGTPIRGLKESSILAAGVGG